MPLKNVLPGASSVPEYQVSSVPFLTSSLDSGELTTTPIKIEFPRVTRYLVITNTSETAQAALRIGFTENGINASPTRNYLILSGTQSTPRLEVRCKSLYLRADGATNTGFSLLAGLTTVERRQYPLMTASFAPFTTGSLIDIFSGVG
tara:strand:+ start:92 stop:535 length:444 start_codon:yes stop_codon:yes gene_type:complete